MRYQTALRPERRLDGDLTTARASARPCEFNKFNALKRWPQAFFTVRPPSTGNATPVMKPAAGSTRLNVACATSSGSA